MAKNSNGQTVFWIVFAVAIVGLVALMAGGVSPSVQTRATGSFYPPPNIIGPGPGPGFPNFPSYEPPLQPTGPISFGLNGSVPPAGIIGCGTPPGSEPCPWDVGYPPPDTGSGSGPICIVCSDTPGSPCPCGGRSMIGGGRGLSRPGPGPEGPQQPGQPGGPDREPIVGGAGSDRKCPAGQEWKDLYENNKLVGGRCLESGSPESRAEEDCRNKDMEPVWERSDPRGAPALTCRDTSASCNKARDSYGETMELGANGMCASVIPAKCPLFTVRQADGSCKSLIIGQPRGPCGPGEWLVDRPFPEKDLCVIS